MKKFAQLLIVLILGLSISQRVCAELFMDIVNPIETITNKKQISSISGFSTPGKVITLVNNHRFVARSIVNEKGIFQFENVDLYDGINQLELSNARETFYTVAINKDTIAPQITIDKKFFNRKYSFFVNEELTVPVNVKDGLKDIFARLSDGSIYPLVQIDKEKGSYLLRLSIPPYLRYDSDNQIIIVAVDEAGNSSESAPINFTLIPRLVILSPSGNFTSHVKTIRITGFTDPGMSLYVNDEFLDINSDGRFSFDYTLKKDRNLITLRAAGGDLARPLVKELRGIFFNSFKDIDSIKDEVVKKDVNTLSSMKIITRDPDKMFRPDQAITREEIANWLVKALGVDLPEVKYDVARDVKAAYWRAPYIQLCLNYGFFSLDEKGFFYPNREITIEEADKLYKLLGELLLKKSG